MENNAASKSKVSLHCPSALSARGGGSEKFVMFAKRKKDMHFLNF